MVLLRYRKQNGRHILEDPMLALAYPEALTSLKLPVCMPEGVLGNARGKFENNQFGKLELQPKAGRIRKTRPIVVSRDMNCEPAMSTNLFDEVLFMGIK